VGGRTVSAHPYYQAIVHALGMAYRHGNHAKAIPLLEEALTWHEKQWGPNHIAVWSVRHALGWSYMSDGRQADAVKAFEANFIITPKDMVTMEALGWALLLSDIDRSIALYTKGSRHARRETRP
jgi:tetratricopeptide (TPR) repeat protein